MAVQGGFFTITNTSTAASSIGSAVSNSTTGLTIIAVCSFWYLRVDHVLNLHRFFPGKRKGETRNGYVSRRALRCGNGQMAGKDREVSELNVT